MEKAKEDLKKILIQDIEKVYSNIPYKTKNCFHWYLQFYLKRIAKRHGLFGEVEFPVKEVTLAGKKKNGKTRNGLIDVSWHQKPNTKENPIVLIELDSGFRKKSVYKLKQAKSHFKVWIYYGKEIDEDRKAFFEEHDPEGEIIFIYVPLKLKKNTELGIQMKDYLSTMNRNLLYMTEGY